MLYKNFLLNFYFPAEALLDSCPTCLAMNGRGYLWVLSLHFFLIDHWQWNNDYECQWRHLLSLAINNGTITGRGYLWVLSLQIFVIDHELWLEEVICRYCPCKFLSLVGTVPRNYDWKRLFVQYMNKELVLIDISNNLFTPQFFFGTSLGWGF